MTNNPTLSEMERRKDRRRIAARIGERLTYANVMSTIAVFGILAGGGAYAASQIGPNDIAKNAVRAKHIKKNNVKAKHIKRNNVKGKHMAENAVATPTIRDGAVTAEKLADGVEGLQGPKGDKGDAGASSFAADCNEGLPANDVMVRVGSVCIDRYEASVWSARTGGTQLLSEAQIEAACPDTGQNCKGKIFARSQAGVEPARRITWFQAQQALINSGKRLPSNAEWQGAASGTPDGAPCNVSSVGPVNTGSAAGCISDHGANDMVGNVSEWVADWVPASTACPGWGTIGGFSSDDDMCLSGASTTITGPGALIRGGFWTNGSFAGPFTVYGTGRPSDSFNGIGFRGSR